MAITTVTCICGKKLADINCGICEKNPRWKALLDLAFIPQPVSPIAEAEMGTREWQLQRAGLWNYREGRPITADEIEREEMMLKDEVRK